MSLRDRLAALFGRLSIGRRSFDWDDPLDPVGTTTEAVSSGRQPVLRVLHEDGPGGWQFYDDAEPLQGPVILTKEQLLIIDPSLANVRDLPLGWEATRESSAATWVRAKVGAW